MFFRSGKTVSTDGAKIETLLERSVEEIIPSRESLKKLLLSGKQLRVKLGIDPTNPNLHIGRAVTLLKLKDFQNLGHKVVFIIGDATGVVGDTSDKESERPMLSKDEVQSNLASYVAQIQKILDRDLIEVRRNSDWLLKLNYAEIGEQANAFSVADFIARDNIKRRLDEGKRVSLREVLYPLMQGYDSVAVRADVELGGTDQRFNLLAGRTLQEKFKQAPQHIVMTKLILGTDGRKMSASWGNTVNLNDSPTEMFGKVMSIPDSLTEMYLMHATRVRVEEIKNIITKHPKDAKLTLAEKIVGMYHGKDAAQEANDNFVKTFSKGEAPENVIEIKLGAAPFMDTLLSQKVVASKSDYRRLIAEGAVVSVASKKTITDVNALPDVGEIWRIGKHRFIKRK